MLDSYIYPGIQRIILPLAKALDRLGVTASMVTLFGLIWAVVSFIFIVNGLFYWAIGAIILNRLADGIDGAVARLHPRNPKGAFYDSVGDYIFYALIPMGFAFYHIDYAPYASLVLACFLGTGTGFLSQALYAKEVNWENEFSQPKGFFYGKGLMEGSETITFFIVFCLFSDYFIPLAITCSVLSCITIIVRFFSVLKHRVD